MVEDLLDRYQDLQLFCLIFVGIMKEQLPLLTVSDLSISFGTGAGALAAVKNLNFTLAGGKTLAIVGESGSGKSLLALSLMGLLPHTAQVEGSIIWHKESESLSLKQGRSKEWRLLRSIEIGMIFQEPMSALNPIQTVGDQIKEAIQIHQNLNSKIARSLALNWLENVQLPDPKVLYHRYPHQLSGGQKQRVMIAMAMCNHPRLIIADEPTTALDASVQQEIIALMQSLQRAHHMSMIFITHDLSLAADIADDILVMRKGLAIEQAPTKQIFDKPKELYTKALLACRPKPEQKGTLLPTVEDFIQGNDQRVPLVLPPSDTNLLLSVQNLNVCYPGKNGLWGKNNATFKAVQDVSFELKKGTTLGLVGESGCGKSTLVKSLIGLAPIYSGGFRIGETTVTAQSRDQVWRTVRQSIQLIFQDQFSAINPKQNIFDIITEPLWVNGLRNKNELEKSAVKLLDWVQLPQTALYRYPHQFSGGQRQRIGIARALSLAPQLIICDESVSALDVSVQAQILNLLKSLQYELGLTYLFISHDLSVVHYMSDDVLVMQQGRIVESGQAERVLNNPQHPYTRQLMDALPGKAFAL